VKVMLVYFLVNFGARRLIRERGRVRWIVNASVVACAFAILVWMVYTVKYSPGIFPIFLSFLLIAFVSEFLLQRYRKRIILPQIQSGGGDDRELSQ
jgi:hypothetical protein